MNKSMIAAAAAALLLYCSSAAVAWDRGKVDRFAILPDVAGTPVSAEGLTVGSDGNVYVPTSGFNAQGAGNGPPTLFVFRPDGQLLRQVTMVGPSPVLLGLGFNPVTGDLLVCDLGAGKLWNVNPRTGQSSVFMATTGNAGLNAVTFDNAGNVYVSDSFQGIIWKTGPHGTGNNPGQIWIQDPSLAPDGPHLFPPFGANGVEFDSHETLFVNNTANHDIVAVPKLADGSAGKPRIFVTGLNAPDGLAIDAHDNLWVLANQEDEVVVLDPTGKVIAKLGDFRGLTEDGIVRGLLFPASLAFSPGGKVLYVTNFALDIRVATPPGSPPAIDSAWTDQVQRYSIARLRAVIPPIGDNDDNDD